MRRLAERLAEQGCSVRTSASKTPSTRCGCVTSFERFDSLYTGRQLSTDRAIELLIETAERALYAKPD
jgi:hypothetical protein